MSHIKMAVLCPSVYSAKLFTKGVTNISIHVDICIQQVYLWNDYLTGTGDCYRYKMLVVSNLPSTCWLNWTCGLDEIQVV